MIRAKQLFVVGAALALFAVAAAAQDSVNLRVMPAKDASFKIKYTGEISLMGVDAKAQYTQTSTISAVTENSFTITSGSPVGTVEFGGQTMEMPDMSSTTTIGIDGITTKVEGMAAGPEAYRSAAVATVFRPAAPVAVGSEWTWNADANAELGTLKMEGKYKLEAIEEIAGEKAAKISMDVKEVEGASPASGKGTVWISTTTGMVIKSTGDFKNLPMPGAPEPVSGKLTSEIVK